VALDLRCFFTMRRFNVRRSIDAAFLARTTTAETAPRVETGDGSEWRSWRCRDVWRAPALAHGDSRGRQSRPIAGNRSRSCAQASISRLKERPRPRQQQPHVAATVPRTPLPLPRAAPSRAAQLVQDRQARLRSLLPRSIGPHGDCPGL
jgi:hypothetical protein